MSDTLRDELSSGWDEQAAVPETPAPAAPEVTHEDVGTGHDSGAVDHELQGRTGQRPRDEFGRFTRKEETPAVATASPEVSLAAPEKPQEAAPAVSSPAVERPWLTGTAPPPGWSPAAKFEFEKLPPAVKESIAKREAEVEQGFAKFADYKGLDEFATMARNSGTTITEAVGRYVEAERFLQRDPINAIAWLANEYGVDLGQFGGQQGQGHQTPADPMSPIMQQLHAMNERLQQYETRTQQQQTEAINRQISAFAAKPEHKYFANVEDRMAVLMESGQAKDLEDAYQQATWSHPDIRSLLIKEQQAQQMAQAQQVASNAKRAAASLPTGAPVNGASPGGAPKSNLRAELESNWDSSTI